MIFLNPSFDPFFLYDPPGSRPLEFHKKLPDYEPTPLHVLNGLAAQCGVEKILVKNESRRLGLPAFKILGASWATFCAVTERFPEIRTNWETVHEFAGELGKHGEFVLYSATDGNHGRAVARVAKLFGLQACIYVPGGTVEARISAIQGEGATVTVVDGTYDDTVAAAANDAELGRGMLIQDNGWKGYEVIPRYVIEGYSTMLHEIDAEIKKLDEQQPTHVFVQIGVGSFAEAVIRHYRIHGSRTVVIGVEPDSAACGLESVKAGKMVKVPGPHNSIMAGMNCDSPSLVSFEALQKGISAFITISDDRSREAMRLLGRNDIVSGETGAAGMGALLETLSQDKWQSELKIDSESRLLLISTEGKTDPASYHAIIGS